jgi:hypothetical protein
VQGLGHDDRVVGVRGQRALLRQIRDERRLRARGVDVDDVGAGDALAAEAHRVVGVAHLHDVAADGVRIAARKPSM